MLYFSGVWTRMQTRLRLRITGVVQGVGFRPFVYGLAQRYGLTGFVGNDSNGVFVEVQGTPEVWMLSVPVWSLRHLRCAYRLCSGHRPACAARNDFCHCSQQKHCFC